MANERGGAESFVDLTNASDDEDFDSEVEEFEEMIEARLAKARAIVNQKGKAKKAAAGKGKGDGR